MRGNMIFIKKRIIPYILIFTLVFGFVAKPIKAEASFLGLGAAVVSAEVAKTVGTVTLSLLATAGITILVNEATETFADMANAVGSSIINNYNTLDGETQGFISTIRNNLVLNPLHYRSLPVTLTNAIFQTLFGWGLKAVQDGSITANVSDFGQSAISTDALANLSEERLSELGSATKLAFITTALGSNVITYAHYIYTLPETCEYVVWDDGTSASLYDAEFKPLSGHTMKYEYTSYSGTDSISWRTFETAQSVITFNSQSCVQGVALVNSDFIEYQRSISVTAEGETDDIVAPVLTGPVNVSLSDAENVAIGTKAATDIYATEAPTTDTPVTDTTTGVLDWLKSGWDVFTNILDAVIAIPVAIVDGLLDGIKSLFIPSDAAIEEVKTELDEKVPAIGEIQAWSDDFVYVMDNPEAYASTLNFNVDFGKADTYWDYGGSSTNMISLEWYFDYKDKIDEIIVGIAWLVFIWNLFGQLPAIISAVGTGVYLDTRNTHINNQGAGKTKKKGGGE